VAEDSRRIVVLALTERAAGRRRTDWARIKRIVGLDAGNKGVYRRYTRAIAGIAKRLNAGLAKAGA
jgi:pantothenate kinase type III